MFSQERVGAYSQSPVGASLKNNRRHRVFGHQRYEGENENHGKNGKTYRQKYSDKSLELRGTIDPGRFLHAGRNRIEVTFDHPDVTRDAAEIDKDQRRLGVQAQPANILPGE